jgi:hypothetical protein
MRNSMRRSSGTPALRSTMPVLHLDGAAHSIDHTAEFDDAPVASPLHHTAMMHRDGRIDQVVAKRPQSRQRALFVRAGESAVTDHIGDQDRRYLALAMFRCHVGVPPVPVDK